MLIPVELPWTQAIASGWLYNFLYQSFQIQVCTVVGHAVSLGDIFVGIWIVVMLVLGIRYAVQYYRVASYFLRFRETTDPEFLEVFDEICKGRKKRNVKIIQTAAVDVPCCMGIWKKRILIPDKEYSRKELRYIILHEYTHLCNGDILTIQLINLLCIVFWWNPFLYLLKKDLNQSMEIRCDQTVVHTIGRLKRRDYLEVIFDAYKESTDGVRKPKVAGTAQLLEHYTDNMLERFQLVADGNPKSGFRRGDFAVIAIAVLVLIGSYSFVLQSYYDIPDDTYSTRDESYEINTQNTYIYERDGEYYLQRGQVEVPIDSKNVERLRNDGFIIKEQGDK